MTRETKIGLLVGLAFIIVIGILLSDHMTSTTEPPKAPLSVAGANVRESIAAPSQGEAPVAAAVGPTAPQVAPNQPVLTGSEIAAQQRQPAQTPVQVGPAQPQAQIPVQVSPASPVVVNPPVTPQQQPVAIAPVTPRSGTSHPLDQIAARHGEELVPVGQPQNNNANPSQPVPMAPLREYKAQAGDSLSKLAGRFMGGNTKANRDAIVRANAALQQNPDKIVEGKVYLIPQAPTAAEAAAPAAQTASAQTNTAQAPAPAPVRTTDAPAAPAAAENFTWYTVKENENLWKIASEQLGSGKNWTQIRDLNPDILKGENALRANMRIRIPNKPVASAS